MSFDVSTPNTARIYDYWLGGKDNFQVDREAAEAIRKSRPDVADLALENKKFLTRAVSFVAEQGVRQFLDVGSGLPTSPRRELGATPLWLATHEAAARAQPEAAVVYVDYDPVAVLHSEALLAAGNKRVAAVLGDMRDPSAIIAGVQGSATGFDLAEPACLILGCVLHFLEPSVARQTVAQFTAAMAPGSYAIISVGYDGGRPDEGDFTNTYNAQAGPRVFRQTRDGVNALFAGLEVLSPGIVDASTWRPDADQSPKAGRAAMILAGVGRVG